jgi:hypothetical protein
MHYGRVFSFCNPGTVLSEERVSRSNSLIFRKMFWVKIITLLLYMLVTWLALEGKMVDIPADRVNFIEIFSNI